MGPADPFSTSKTAEGAPREERRAPSRSTAPAERSRRASLWSGFVVGALFGLLALLFSVGAAVLVLLLGALGALIGWIAHGFTSGGLDLSAAWRALRRR